MTTINEIKDRLNAVAFAGRSYAGADRAAVAKAYTDAVAAFDQNAAVDMAYLLDRIEELQKAITVAADELADAAVSVADRYAGNDAEALEIRLLIGDSVDKLVNIAQGAAASSSAPAPPQQSCTVSGSYRSRAKSASLPTPPRSRARRTHCDAAPRAGSTSTT